MAQRIYTKRGSIVKDWAESLLSIIFPPQCACCDKALLDYEDTICTVCRYDMPITGYFNRKENYVVNLFAGRALFETASALMYFQRGSDFQKMIHRMKYSSRDDIARVLGEIYGAYLAESPFYEDVDLVVPVPLHFSKKIKRGYNQSSEFARAIAGKLGVECYADGLKRERRTKTQARLKTKENRAVNVEGAFVVNKVDRLAGRNILLVDDVITTGATLEECAVAINKEELYGTKLYLGAMAVVAHT